jgi:hypothetical protein
LRTAPAGSWLDRLELELDNLQSTVTWGLAHGQEALVVRLAYALWQFFWIRGEYREVFQWMEAVLGVAEITAATRARARFVAELMRFRMGVDVGLLAAADEIVDQFEKEHDLESTADVLMMAGLASLRAGEVERAQQRLECSRSQFEMLGDQHRSAVTLVFLGGIPLNQGEYARAEGYFQRGLIWPAPMASQA